MVTNPAASRTQEHTALQRMLGRGRFLSLLVLLGGLIVCLAFSWTTRDALAHLPFLKVQKTQHNAGASSQTTLVDLHPWQIAQALAPLAVSKEEEEYAHEAKRLADHEVNQAFATSLRQASTQRLSPTGEALELSQKVAQLQQAVKEDQAQVHALASATDSAGNDELKVAQAQLDLDQDDLSDAQHDLARASGDLRTKIQQELAAHEAAVSKNNAQQASSGQMAVLSTRQYATLAGRLEAWNNQRSRSQLIQQAMQQAKTDAASLMAQHNKLEAQANASSDAAAANKSKPNATELASLQQRREQRQLLSIYDDRIQTQQQLAGVYGKWVDQVRLQHRIVTHLAVHSLATVAFILMCVILLESVGTALLERYALHGATVDRRRMKTLPTILRLGVQLVGVGCVLLVTFGVPSQISTILGLATAGLTVALQSFIVAFFGWFILMGKNGVRVGDWVEINGVGGEVVEVGLLRTTLLESGNWAESGRPTGRRVAFMNSYAIEDHYFNFSTSEQWLWEELHVALPSGKDPYELRDAIRGAVEEITHDDVERATREWLRLSQLHGSLSTLSAQPIVELRPSAGLEVVLRYITRAQDRFEIRSRLNQKLLTILHAPPQVAQAKPLPEGTPTESSAPEH